MLHLQSDGIGFKWKEKYYSWVFLSSLPIEGKNQRTIKGMSKQFVRGTSTNNQIQTN